MEKDWCDEQGNSYPLLNMKLIDEFSEEVRKQEFIKRLRNEVYD